MKDRTGRVIDYLRIAVTDKCNLRCRYCMPEEGVEYIPHEKIMTLEETGRLVSIMTSLGIQKVRITGGEPLVRKNVIKLVRDLGNMEEIHEIAMTTNGVLFAESAEELYRAGLRSVNISLDTMNPELFRGITGFGEYDQVWASIEKALELGMKVKINCVPLRELNEKELLPLAMLARDRKIDVRYIELMPMGCGRNFHGIPSDEILSDLERKFGPGHPSGEKRGNGPARYYDFEGFQGKIGFISPMSHKFCSECNRIRLTADGRLKLCLNYDAGIDLLPLLRGGESDETIREAIREAIWQKPLAHEFEKSQLQDGIDQRKMVQIGG